MKKDADYKIGGTFTLCTACRAEIPIVDRLKKEKAKNLSPWLFLHVWDRLFRNHYEFHIGFHFSVQVYLSFVIAGAYYGSIDRNLLSVYIHVVVG